MLSAVDSMTCDIMLKAADSITCAVIFSTRPRPENSITPPRLDPIIFYPDWTNPKQSIINLDINHSKLISDYNTYLNTLWN